MTTLCWQVEGFVGVFLTALFALYCSLDNRLGKGSRRMCFVADVFEEHLSSMCFHLLRMNLSSDLVGIDD